MNGIITKQVTYISLSTPCRDHAKRKEGLDLVVSTLSNAAVQQGPLITRDRLVPDAVPMGCSQGQPGNSKKPSRSCGPLEALWRCVGHDRLHQDLRYQHDIFRTISGPGGLGPGCISMKCQIAFHQLIGGVANVASGLCLC